MSRPGALLRSGIFCALAGSTGLAGAQKSSSAKRFIESVYARYSKAGTPVSLDSPDAQSVFDPSLIALERADVREASPEVGILDWDPICGCQDDVEIRNLKIDALTEGTTRAKVAVSFDVQDGTHDGLIFTLAKQAGRWRIYNIIDVNQLQAKPAFDLRAELIKAAGNTHAKSSRCSNGASTSSRFTRFLHRSLERRPTLFLR